MQFNVKKTLEATITEIVEECGARVVDISRKTQHKNDVFEVLVDTENGITIGECSDISRALLKALEEALGAEALFQLEVGSPGLDRPLEQEWQYTRHKDRTIKIVMDADGDVASVEGLLLGCEDGLVSVKLRDRVLQVPLTAIRSALVQPSLKQG
jgi:ribosome maturation factor RimP